MFGPSKFIPLALNSMRVPQSASFSEDSLCTDDSQVFKSFWRLGIIKTDVHIKSLHPAVKLKSKVLNI